MCQCTPGQKAVKQGVHGPGHWLERLSCAQRVHWGPQGSERQEHVLIVVCPQRNAFPQTLSCRNPANPSVLSSNAASSKPVQMLRLRLSRGLLEHTRNTWLWTLVFCVAFSPSYSVHQHYCCSSHSAVLRIKQIRYPLWFPWVQPKTQWW